MRHKIHSIFLIVFFTCTEPTGKRNRELMKGVSFCLALDIEEVCIKPEMAKSMWIILTTYVSVSLILVLVNDCTVTKIYVSINLILVLVNDCAVIKI